jgi:Ca-activated chloride channel family protein
MMLVSCAWGLAARADSAPAGKAGAPVPLGADRPLVTVPLPDPPAGAAIPFSFDDGKSGWVARVPGGGALPSPAFGDGRLYVSPGGSATFYALDAETGRLAWTNGLADGGPSAPVYDKGNVMFNTGSCTLYVLDAKTGAKRWTRWLGSHVLAQPAYADGLIYAAYPASDGVRLGAFRLEDGKPAWEKVIPGELMSAPVIDGDSVYLTSVDGTTLRFARKDGTPVWSAALGGTSAPWVSGGELFLSRAADGGAASELQVALSAATGKPARVLRTADASYFAGGSRALDARLEGSRPVVLGGRRFDTMAGAIVAADPRGGAPLWERRYTEGAGTRALTAPAVAGSMIFFSTYGGDLYALDTDTGMTVWSYRLGAAVQFQPIVARGWVYVATNDGRVVGLSLADASLDGWHMWGGNPAHNGPVL